MRHTVFHPGFRTRTVPGLRFFACERCGTVHAVPDEPRDCDRCGGVRLVGLPVASCAEAYFWPEG